MFKNMGGNFPGGDFPGGESLMCGNFPGRSFPDTVLTIDLKHYYYYSWGFIESWKKDKKRFSDYSFKKWRYLATLANVSTT